MNVSDRSVGVEKSSDSKENTEIGKDRQIESEAIGRCAIFCQFS